MEREETKKKVENWIKLCRDRLNEEEFGKYDKQKLYENHENNEDCDMADYTGPVKVVEFGGKGKGMIVTKGVKKAFYLWLKPTS